VLTWIQLKTAGIVSKLTKSPPKIMMGRIKRGITFDKTGFF
jgi:hypothetical protein